MKKNIQVVPGKLSEKLRKKVFKIYHKVELTIENSLVKPQLERGLKKVHGQQYGDGGMHRGARWHKW